MSTVIENIVYAYTEATVQRAEDYASKENVAVNEAIKAQDNAAGDRARAADTFWALASELTNAMAKKDQAGQYTEESFEARIQLREGLSNMAAKVSEAQSAMTQQLSPMHRTEMVYREDVERTEMVSQEKLHAERMLASLIEFEQKMFLEIQKRDQEEQKKKEEERRDLGKGSEEFVR